MSKEEVERLKTILPYVEELGGYYSNETRQVLINDQWYCDHKIRRALNFKKAFLRGVESINKNYDKGILEGMAVDKDHIKKKNIVAYTVHLPAIDISLSKDFPYDELIKLHDIEEFENEVYYGFGVYVMKENGGSNG